MSASKEHRPANPSSGVGVSDACAQANQWFMRTKDGGMTDEDNRAFEAWRAADPAHARAYDARKTAWEELGRMAEMEGVESLMAPTFADSIREQTIAAFASVRKAVGRPRFAPMIGGAAAATVLLLIAANVRDLTIPAPTPSQALAMADYMTEVAEIREVTLADGSVVTLGAQSALDVDFSAGQRRVELIKGEAFFDVEKDPARPFLVAADDMVVRVLGTKFDVHLGAEAVRVSVAEGRVEVLKPDETAELAEPEGVSRVLTGGERVIAEKQGDVLETETVAANSVAAWRAGRLVYVDAPLKEIIADMNRYSNKNILFADPAIGEIEYTAVFKTDEIDAMVTLMAASLGIEAAQSRDSHIVLGQRR